MPSNVPSVAFIDEAPRSPSDVRTYRQLQVNTIGTLYAAYAVSMLLRMIPTVAGTSIRDDVRLGVDLENWGHILAAGTCGAMAGKFLCGWAADCFGGKRTFTVALFVASACVGLFAASSTIGMFQVFFFFTLMAQAAGWPSMAKVITNWFSPNKYGRVWGVLSTSSRIGTLCATLALGSLLSWISWRAMLGLASLMGFVISTFYALTMRDRPPPDTNSLASPVSAEEGTDVAPSPMPHPLDSFGVVDVLPKFAGSLRFWLISGSLMGLTILWDFLLLVPMYLKDTLRLETAQASMAASAFPLGSLISVLIGGYVFDRVARQVMAVVMAGLLGLATMCLLVFVVLPQWSLSETTAMIASLSLLFLFGLCVSPCYYIPASVFSIDFGGRHSGVLVAILDAMGFAATALFYFFGGGMAKKHGWSTFLLALVVVAVWSLLTTFLFMWREARTKQQIVAVE